MPRIFYFLLILSSVLGFLLLTAGPQTDISTIDFKPREGWNIKGPLNVQPDGRMTLLQDGLGVAWKFVELDVDEFPMMLAVVTNTLPRERWAIIVERGERPTLDKKNEITLIEKFAEEGGFFFHLKKSTGWQGLVKFIISVVVEGRSGDRIVLDNLEAVIHESKLATLHDLTTPPRSSSKGDVKVLPAMVNSHIIKSRPWEV